MTGIYFSGTGNTKYLHYKFLKEYDCSKNSFSIEDSEALERIKNDDEIVMGYPVQYSNIPKILRDYIVNNRYVWKGKNIFIIATMGLFSGDGAGILARLLKNYGAVIVGGLHLKMPDSICDERALKRSFEHNKRIVSSLNKSIQKHNNLMDCQPYVKHRFRQKSERCFCISSGHRDQKGPAHFPRFLHGGSAGCIPRRRATQ